MDRLWTGAFCQVLSAKFEDIIDGRLTTWHSRSSLERLQFSLDIFWRFHSHHHHHFLFIFTNHFVMPNQTYLDPSTALEHLKTYDHQDGLSVAELIDSRSNGGLTYNDFLMLPGKIDFAAGDVLTETKITRNVVLKTPFMSSPMDTVTEGEMAISMAVSLPSFSP